MYFSSLTVLACLLTTAGAYMPFQKRIPNGDSVPFPCKPGQSWPAVGHINDAGAGTRNPFGRDFEEAGYRWTEKLCRQDSDGDGLQNGMELGDPDCTWTENGSMPKTSQFLSHPGICDPWDSAASTKKIIISPTFSTQGDWLKDVCKSQGFECAALSDKDIMNATAKLPELTPIPVKVTTYECLIFNIYDIGVPKDTDYHMVAVTPTINNTDVIHHMVLFGCTDNTPVIGVFECEMVPSPTCRDFLHVWTVGLDGECYHPDSGIRIGKTGYKTMAIQYHWTNIEKTPGRTDSSGLILHFTPNLKPHDAGVLLVGSALFFLPPKQEEVMVYSKCSSGCTKQIIKGSINITSAWNHMHYTGKDMLIEIMRRNQHLTYLTYDRVYSYDSPQVQIYSTPLEIFPGDSIVTQCGFSTMDRNKTTFYGDATLDEMCFAFITYYPKQNMAVQYCVDKLGISTCDPSSLEGCSSIGQFLKMINTTDVFKEVTNNCRKFSPCLPECVDTIVNYMRSEPCMKGNIWRLIQNELSKVTNQGFEFLSRIASCKAEIEMAMKMTTKAGVQSDTDGGRATTASATLALMAVFTNLIWRGQHA